MHWKRPPMPRLSRTRPVEMLILEGHDQTNVRALTMNINDINVKPVTLPPNQITSPYAFGPKVDEWVSIPRCGVMNAQLE